MIISKYRSLGCVLYEILELEKAYQNGFGDHKKKINLKKYSLFGHYLEKLENWVKIKSFKRD